MIYKLLFAESLVYNKLKDAFKIIELLFIKLLLVLHSLYSFWLDCLVLAFSLLCAIKTNLENKCINKLKCKSALLFNTTFSSVRILHQLKIDDSLLILFYIVSN